MKIATWNVNSLKVRLPQVLAWLAAREPDALLLQETKLADEQFPVAAFNEAGWHVAYSGQKAYNGVALISRTPAQAIVTAMADQRDPDRRILGATVAGVRLYNLYVPNGSEVGSAKFDYKLDWLARMREHLRQERRHHAQLVVAGDFNIAPTDADVHDPEALAGQIHCSDAERSALTALQDDALIDVFRAHPQPERAFSWWDYRARAFRRNLGLRIDLILATHPLAARCSGCEIDVEPRRNDRPSDHAPVMARFETDTPRAASARIGGSTANR